MIDTLKIGVVALTELGEGMMKIEPVSMGLIFHIHIYYT